MSVILAMKPVIRDSRCIQLISKAAVGTNALIIMLFVSHIICVLLALFVDSVTYILFKVWSTTANMNYMVLNARVPKLCQNQSFKCLIGDQTMLWVDLPFLNQCNHRIQMVTLHELFGNLCTQQKLESVCCADMCASLQILSSTSATVAQSSCFLDQVSGLAVFWKLALSSSDVETSIWFVLGFTSPDLTLLPLSSICTS